MKALIQCLCLAFAFVYLAAFAQTNIDSSTSPESGLSQSTTGGSFFGQNSRAVASPSGPQTTTGGAFFGQSAKMDTMASATPARNGNTGNLPSYAVPSISPQGNPSPYQPVIPVPSPGNR